MKVSGTTTGPTYRYNCGVVLSCVYHDPTGRLSDDGSHCSCGGTDAGQAGDAHGYFRHTRSPCGHEHPRVHVPFDVLCTTGDASAGDIICVIFQRLLQFDG